eukprot:IDg5401t1
MLALITTALALFGKQQLPMQSNLNLMCMFGFVLIGSYAVGALRQRASSYAMSVAELWGVDVHPFVYWCINLVGYGARRA